MALIASDVKMPRSAPAPAGLNQAVCVDAVDLGLKDTKWGQKPKIRLRWALDLIDPETGKNFYVSKQYTLSLNEKSILCKDLETWRGVAFTPEEKAGFDLEKLIGVNCQVQTARKLGEDGSTYAVVQAVVALGKGMTKLRIPDDYVREKWKTDGQSAVDNSGSSEGEDEKPF